MKLFLLALLILSSLPALAMEASVSGNVEVQGRHSWNNPEAQNLPFPITQDWNQSDSYLAVGNLNPKLEFKNSRLEANWFLRHSVSELYRNDYLAPRVYTFPNKLVARDLFKLQYRHEGPESQTDSVINKLYYEWSVAQHRVSLGRIFINYGTGEIFNPINPFNQPTGLTSISNVAQGNDGGQLKLFLSDQHTLDLMVLGDKSLENYQGGIDRTLWIHGELLPNDKIQLDYVGGQDQKRNKLGSQISYKFPEAMVFFQTFYQTAYFESDFQDSHSLLDILLGYDEQLTAKWHLRLEGGYQQKNRKFAFDPAALGDRFLPVEYFIALAQQYEIHPLVKVGGTLISDFTTGFTYFIARSTFSIGNNFEADIFAFTPLAKGKSDKSPENQANNLAQKLVTQDLGLAVRAFF